MPTGGLHLEARQYVNHGYTIQYINKSSSQYQTTLQTLFLNEAVCSHYNSLIMR